MLKEHWGEMKLNEPKKQTSERQNSKQYAKHLNLGSDLLQVLNRERLIGLESRQRGALISAFAIPHGRKISCTHLCGFTPSSVITLGRRLFPLEIQRGQQWILHVDKSRLCYLAVICVF